MNNRAMHLLSTPFRWVILSLSIISLAGCSEQQGAKDKDDEVRESDSKDSSGDDSSGKSSAGKDSSGDNKDSEGDSGNSGDSGGGTDSDGSGGSKESPASMMRYSSGSRLSPVLLEADDGAKQFYGWYDSKLETPCSFSMRSATTMPQKESTPMRCLPPMATVSKTNYFTNNSCDPDKKIEIMVIPKCADMQKFKYGVVPAKACGEESKIYEIKSVRQLGSRDFTWHNMGTRDCSIVTDEELLHMGEVELGEEVDLSIFVTAQAKKQ